MIVKPRRRSRAQPAALAAAVERVAGLPAGLPAGTLDAPPTHRRGVRLVQRVDRDTADRLAEGAEVAGYQATVASDPIDGPLRALAQVFWLPIPVMWVCFPFLVSSGIAPPELILPLFVVLTIIISALGAAVLPSPVPKDAPLAYGRHATPLLPAAPPATPPPQPAGDPLVAGARRALIGLQAAVTAHAELAAPARQDLEATICALTGEVDAAERGLTAVSAALDGHGPPVDGRSAAARLERLDALERAGQVADPSERARLRRIVTHVREAEVARGELEDRQAAARAHLLEVAAVAERTRVELASAAVPAMSGRLARQLRSDADAVAAARHELAGRQRAPER